MYPDGFIFSWPTNNSDDGEWPMAMNTPSISRSLIAPVLMFLMRTRFTFIGFSEPSTSSSA